MTPSDPSFIRATHDERMERLRRSRRWAEDRPARRRPGGLAADLAIDLESWR